MFAPSIVIESLKDKLRKKDGDQNKNEIKVKAETVRWLEVKSKSH